MKHKILVSISPYLLLLLVFASCENSLQEINSLTDLSKKKAVENAKEVEMIYSEEGNVRLRLTAPLLISHKDKVNPYIEFPEGLEMNFYNKKLKKTSKLTAKYGIKYANKQIVEMKDSIVFLNSKKHKLETEKLIYDERKKILRSDTTVKMTRGREVLYGTGMFAKEDDNFSKVRIDNPKGSVKVGMKKP